LNLSERIPCIFLLFFCPNKGLFFGQDSVFMRRNFVV